MAPFEFTLCLVPQHFLLLAILSLLKEFFSDVKISPCHGNPLVVQWLGICASTAWGSVQSLAGKLRSYMPRGMTKKRKISECVCRMNRNIREKGKGYLAHTSFYPSYYLSLFSHRASLVAQTVKNLPAMWETWVWSLGWEDPLEKGMATHSNILAWRILWTV